MLRGTLPVCLVVPTLLGGVGCSGGGGGGEGPTSEDFEVDAFSVPEGAVWPINREIVIGFSDAIDFATVSANTIRIRSADGVPATGEFSLRDPRTVVFQPSCPVREDLADAGLHPGGVTYGVRLPGKRESTNTVRSVGGGRLGVQQARTFVTPESGPLPLIFEDVHDGPPAPVLRPRGSGSPAASYLEVGGDPDRRVYFEVDDLGRVELSEAGFTAPLNLYSTSSSRIAFVLAFDQPISPSPRNLGRERLRLEYREGASGWRPIETRATLEQNCGGTGARVRLEPIGVVPPASEVRAVMLPGFQDLIGQPVLAARTVAEVPVGAVEYPELEPRDGLADAFVEPFDFGADSPRSFQDGEALFDAASASWDDGVLSSVFSFEGTGGPSGTFDWVVHAGERFNFDTTRTEIIGGPGGLPTATIVALDGVVDVHDFVIEARGFVRVQGPNPLRIRATGEVRIDGELDVSGFSAKNVVSIDTGNLSEVGGVGVAGGGSGGKGNVNTRGTSLRGGPGDGPFDLVGAGGRGGETGLSNGSEASRRPGGGGGGRFARDFSGTSQPSNCSVAATAGTDGHPLTQGVDPFDGHSPARGGEPGPAAFSDEDEDNDFFGRKPVVENGALTGFLRGELAQMWAGSGGGGGGNSTQRFPNGNWNPSQDEKGGGGGGGGGGVLIQALGKIVFGPAGQLLCNGGRGATGENTIQVPRLAGTGGGGSGGHVILESAVAVDFTGGGSAADERLVEAILACGPVERTENPYGNGGAGGPGLIQLHVPEAARAVDGAPPPDLILPDSARLEPDPLDLVTSPPPQVLLPTFGKRSKARSRWIPISGAGARADGTRGPVRFLFDGIDPESGRVRSVGDRVATLAPLVESDDLAADPGARVQADGLTLVLSGARLAELRTGTTAGLSNDLYLRTPALLENAYVRLFLVTRPGLFQDHAIVAARTEEGTAASGDERLLLTVEAEAGLLTDFPPDGVTGKVGLHLLPRFFEVRTGGVADFLSDTSLVRMRFQAARETPGGFADELDPLTPWTSDLADFNALAPGALRFFRFEVEFDLDTSTGSTTLDRRPLSLDFLRLPYSF